MQRLLKNWSSTCGLHHELSLPLSPFSLEFLHSTLQHTYFANLFHHRLPLTP